MEPTSVGPQRAPPSICLWSSLGAPTFNTGPLLLQRRHFLFGLHKGTDEQQLGSISVRAQSAAPPPLPGSSACQAQKVLSPAAHPAAQLSPFTRLFLSRGDRQAALCGWGQLSPCVTYLLRPRQAALRCGHRVTVPWGISPPQAMEQGLPRM